MFLSLLQAAENNDFNIDQSTVVWVLIVVILVLLAVYIIQRIRP